MGMKRESAEDARRHVALKMTCWLNTTLLISIYYLWIVWKCK